MKHRILTLFSALLFAFALLPVNSVNASDEFIYNNSYIGNFIEQYKTDGFVDPHKMMSALYDENVTFYAVEDIGTWESNGLFHKRFSIAIPLSKTSTINLIDDKLTYEGDWFYSFTYSPIETGLDRYSKSYSGGSDIKNFSFEYGNLLNNSFGMAIDKSTFVYYYNPNGGSLGDNDFDLATPNADKSLLEMDVNTMRIVKPVSNASIDTENNTIFADRDYFDFELQVKIAIPDDITLDSHTRSPLWGTRDLGEFVKRNKNAFLGQSLAVEFPNALFADVKSVEELGTNRDWVNNHCVIYIVKGQVALDSNHSDLNDVKLTIGCNIITDFYSVVSADYLWINDTVTMNLSYHKDLDGDGIDDETGEVIPTDSLVDTDGDGVPDDAKITGDSFFERFTDDMKKVPKYSDDVGDLYNQIFGMFPPPVPQLITLGICLIIFVSVIGFIRG